MKEKNLLASVALFGEIYNNPKFTNIFDIVAEFIKGAVLYEKKTSLTSTEVRTLLQKVYDFKIPESVIKSTLNNKLKSNVQREGAYYDFTQILLANEKDLQTEFDGIIKNQNTIFNDLVEFITKKERKVLSEKDKETIHINFNHFLMDNGYSDQYSDYISAFIVKNENNAEFKANLNIIKEGLILYQGINFTADLNELGKWNTELTIFLNTEHLFGGLGYNGLLFQEIFNDFLTLVNEINNSERNQNQNNKINLRYLPETMAEVDRFFTKAEYIKLGKQKLDPSKAAMKLIIDTCIDITSIKALRIKFTRELTLKSILEQEVELNMSELTKYNVEDASAIETLSKHSQENGKEFSDFISHEYFKIFTKINFLRKGKSDVPLERVGYIFMTENSFAQFLAHHHATKFDDKDTPFAKNIEFITTKFWFKLKKGFSDKQTLPKSFDVTTKARIILSGHLTNSVAAGYQKLEKDVADGKLQQEEALERSYGYRERLAKPEEITEEIIDSSLDFLKNESYFEELANERAYKEILMSETQKQNEQLKAELQRIEAENKEKELKIKKEKNAKKKAEFIDEKWLDEKRKNRADIFILISVVILNSILAVFTLSVSISADFKKWLAEFGISQMALLAVVVVIILVEVLGRSYLFNKEKIKNGWLHLQILISSSKKYDFEEKKKKEFKLEFDSLNEIGIYKNK
ncbi:MAG: hypothetical protein V4506_08935 [Bacteroidota bacterium]